MRPIPIEYLVSDKAMKLTIEEMNEINLFKESLKESVKTHYVQSILVRDQEAINVAKRFKSIGFDDVIYTHLDEPKYCGMIYNFQNIFDVPAHSFSIGSQIPEDFEAATKERFVDLLFNLSNRRKEEVVNG